MHMNSDWIKPQIWFGIGIQCLKVDIPRWFSPHHISVKINSPADTLKRNKETGKKKCDTYVLLYIFWKFELTEAHFLNCHHIECAVEIHQVKVNHKCSVSLSRSSPKSDGFLLGPCNTSLQSSMIHPLSLLLVFSQVTGGPPLFLGER